MTYGMTFSILVCVGGGPQSLTGVRFASHLEHGGCENIDLLYVRPVDRTLSSGGMEVRVARENMLDWGLELPGTRALNTARDILVEMGDISRQDEVEVSHREVSGDPVGDHYVEHRTGCGRRIGLHLKTANDLSGAVEEECEKYGYTLVIVGASGEYPSGFKRFFQGEAADARLAEVAPSSVIVARDLKPCDENGGYLVCTDGSDDARAMLPRAAQLATRSGCAVSVLCVAQADDEHFRAGDAVAEAAAFFRDHYIEVREEIVAHGDPVEQVLTHAADHSLIIVGDSGRHWLSRTLSDSLPITILKRASVSVMIGR